MHLIPKQFNKDLLSSVRIPKSAEGIDPNSFIEMKLLLKGYRVIKDDELPPYIVLAVDGDDLMTYNSRNNGMFKMHKDQFVKQALNNGMLSVAEKITGQKFITRH